MWAPQLAVDMPARDSATPVPMGPACLGVVRRRPRTTAALSNPSLRTARPQLRTQARTTLDLDPARARRAPRRDSTVVEVRAQRASKPPDRPMAVSRLVASAPRSSTTVDAGFTIRLATAAVVLVVVDVSSSGVIHRSEPCQLGGFRGSSLALLAPQPPQIGPTVVEVRACEPRNHGAPEELTARSTSAPHAKFGRQFAPQARTSRRCRRSK
jgi:hypothetical protein